MVALRNDLNVSRRKKEKAADDRMDGGGEEILAQGIDDETMPSWLPPSPPLSDEDEMKFDETFDLLYEIDPMNETRLPSQIHELRRPLMERQKVQNDILSPLEVKPPPPEERFSPVFADSDEDYKKKRRRDARRNNEVKRATTPPPPTKEEEDYDGAEWCIIEDYELLRAVQNEMTNMHDLERSRNHAGMMLNWELVASAVNRHTRFYRSARQCCIRYQMFVRPKELGQLVTSDPITKRTVKVDLTPTELSHLRKGRVSTEQQFVHDCASILEKKHVSRFKMVKSLKKPTSFWRGAKEAREPVGKIPEDHEKKLESLDVKLETNWDVEELGEVVTETKKKDKLREGSPKPRTNVFIERPHVFKVAKGEKLAPRGHRVINVPPLQTLPQFVPHQQAPQQIMRRASTSQGIYQSNYVMMNTAGPEGGAQTQRIVPQTTRAYSTNAPVVVQTAQRGQQRVFRSGMTGRVMMQNADRGTAFTASNVRLMHPTQRVVAPGARRAQPQPGTVAAMVMSNRGGAVSHLRSIPRNYQGQNRINLMVGPQGQLRQQGHIVTSGNAVKRQLMTTARPGNREQSVAQVVLAPPTSNSSSQPPILHVQPRTQQQEPQTQAPQPPPTNNQ